MKIQATNAKFIDDYGHEQKLPDGVLTIGRADIVAEQKARIAELEAKLERCIKLAAFALENEDSVSDVWDWAKGCSWHCDEWQEIVADVRAAIETPEPLA